MTHQVRRAVLSDTGRQVLAIHCTMAYCGAWRGLAKVLDGKAAFKAFDMPSHGGSPDWSGPGDLVDGVAAIAAEIAAPGPVDVIGHSFGGVAALRMALLRPDLVRSLTLIEPVLMCVAGADRPDILAIHDKDVEPVVQAMADGDHALAARYFNAIWAGPDRTKWPDIPERVRAEMARAIPFVQASGPALFDDALGLLQPGVLAAISCPVQLIYGTRTHVVVPVVIDGLARRIPGAEVAKVEGAAHMVPISHPEETGAIVSAFFDAHPA